MIDQNDAVIHYYINAAFEDGEDRAYRRMVEE